MQAWPCVLVSLVVTNHTALTLLHASSDGVMVLAPPTPFASYNPSVLYLKAADDGRDTDVLQAAEGDGEQQL